jgi:hypothetical protein
VNEMSKQIDLNKLENKLREKIKSLRYFMVPLEYFKKEIINVIREFNKKADCYYFINFGETIVEDEYRDYIIRYEIATDELSCNISVGETSVGEIVGEIKMKRLIYRKDDINPDMRIDIIDLINIRLDLEYEDEEDDDYVEEEEDFEEDFWEDDEESDYYDDEDVSDYYMDLLDSQYEEIFNRFDDVIIIDDP